MITASSIVRARRCPASHALPGVSRSSASAARGTAVHRYVELVAGGVDTTAALEMVPAEHRDLCARIDTRRLPHGAETEVSFALDVLTGTARRTGVRDREYTPGPSEICGTVDAIVGRRVIDYKTTAHSEFDPERYRAQLSLYGAMVAMADRLGSVSCEVVLIGEDGGVGTVLEWELDSLDIADVIRDARLAWDLVRQAVADRIAHETRSVARWEPSVSEGAWCVFCPAFVHCPGKRAAVEAVLGLSVGEITTTNAGAALARARDAEAIVKRVAEVARAMVAEHGPLPTGDGRVARFDGRGALRLVRAA